MKKTHAPLSEVISSATTERRTAKSYPSSSEVLVFSFLHNGKESVLTRGQVFGVHNRHGLMDDGMVTD